MIRYMLLLYFFSIAAIGKAQDGYTHFFARGGLVYKNAGKASIGFDLARKYHNAYELALTYYRPHTGRENYLLGINYKPVIVRNKNSTFRFRFGGYAGTDMDKFIAAPNMGFEFHQAIAPKLDLIFANNNGFMFWGEKHNAWRIDLEVGLKFSL
ncbi:MAG TPA: hypothetical protein VKZ57_02775 [Sphingobacterium sp.]|nr:hypothetical protein [Sphingobacterium sp.]